MKFYKKINEISSPALKSKNFQKDFNFVNNKENFEELYQTTYSELNTLKNKFFENEKKMNTIMKFNEELENNIQLLLKENKRINSEINSKFEDKHKNIKLEKELSICKEELRINTKNLKEFESNCAELTKNNAFFQNELEKEKFFNEELLKNKVQLNKLVFELQQMNKMLEDEKNLIEKEKTNIFDDFVLYKELNEKNFESFEQKYQLKK